MSLRKQIKSVLSSNNACTSEPEPIVLNAPPIYNKKVKIHDWQMYNLAEPRDNTNFFPPEGNLYLGSYKRLGTDFPEIISETKSMLQQIYTEYKYPESKSRLLNMLSVPMADVCDEKNGNIITFGDKSIDYSTTTQRDFQISYVKKLPPIPPKELPKSLYRRTLGYSLEDLSKRNGVNTFLDDNLELHERIAAFKIQRHKSYDPTLLCYTNPYKYIK